MVLFTQIDSAVHGPRFIIKTLVGSISLLHDFFDMSASNSSERIVAIVGAGLTGLLAAQGLKQVRSGLDPTIQGGALLTVTRMDST